MSGGRTPRFTPEEDAAIMKARQSNPSESWKAIAILLPGRTAQQCQSRWANYLSHKVGLGPWTPEEDQLLVKKANEIGRHWRAIGRSFYGRSSLDIRNRWYHLRYGVVDDGTAMAPPVTARPMLGDGLDRRCFSPEEDEIMIRAKQLDPSESWEDIAKRVPGRTARQCAQRWANYLSPEIRSEPWTPEEDRLLVEKVKEMGQSWGAIKPFFNGRSGPNIISRWRSLRSAAVDEGPDAGGRESNHVNAPFSIVQEGRQLEVVEAPLMSSTQATGLSVMYRQLFTPATDAAIMRTSPACTYFVFENGRRMWTQHTPRRA
jgi:hypothetical protein